MLALTGSLRGWRPHSAWDRAPAGGRGEDAGLARSAWRDKVEEGPPSLASAAGDVHL